MKRILCAALSIAILLSLGSCASAPEKDSVPAPETDTAPAEDSAAPPEAAETAEQDAGTPADGISENSLTGTTEDGGALTEPLPPGEVPVIPPLAEEDADGGADAQNESQAAAGTQDAESAARDADGKRESPARENAGTEAAARDADGKPPADSAQTADNAARDFARRPDGADAEDGAESGVKGAPPEAVPQTSPGAGTDAARSGESASDDTTRDGGADAESGGGSPAPENPPEQAAPPVPSRSVVMKRNQTLDVTYPGSGWLYLGQTDGQNDFVFGGRKLGEKDTTFTLRSRKAGTRLLHFYKNDGLTGKSIDDYLEVTVTDEAGSHERITAPAYADAVPPPAKITAETVRAAEEAERQRALTDGAERNVAAAESGAETPRPDGGGKSAAAAAGAADTHSESESAARRTAPGRTAAAAADTPPSSEAAATPAVSARETPPRRNTADAGSAREAARSGNAAASSAAREAASRPAGSENSAREAPQEISGALPSSAARPETGGEEDSAGDAPDAAADGGISATADELLAAARRLFEAGEYAQALETLNTFFGLAVSGIDEGLFLQGQILESKSETRNIKGAIDSYDLIIKNYPASRFWDQANRRSIFLKRFYINIR